MALDNLRDFLGALDARGELARVTHPVSVDKQITEVADRCMKSPGGGPAAVRTPDAPVRCAGALSRGGEPVRLRKAHGPGTGRRVPGRDRRADRDAAQHEGPGQPA